MQTNGTKTSYHLWTNSSISLNIVGTWEITMSIVDDYQLVDKSKILQSFQNQLQS